MALPDNFKHYMSGLIGQDAVASIVITILLIPQSLAYAQLASLPPEVGLMASILPLVAYALLGRSSVLAVGPVAIVALMTAAALQGAGIVDPTAKVAAAGVLALMIGGILIAAGLLRLGFLANYLSQPVIHGFIISSSIIILISQLRHMLDVTLTAHEPLFQFLELVQSLVASNPTTVILGLATFAILFGFPKAMTASLPKSARETTIGDLLPRVAPLVAIAVTAFAAVVLPAVQVPLTGEVSTALPDLTAITQGLGAAELLWPSALLIALIAFTESLAVARSFAARKKEKIEANRELIAIGAANAAAALSGGMPVAGGFARTAVSFAAGAATRAAGAMTAGLIALSLVFFTGLYAYIPKVTLAVIIIFSISKMIRFGEILPIWRYSPLDAGVYALTAGGVFLLGVEMGLLMGVVLSIIIFIARAGRPHIAQVGRIAGSEHFRNVRRHSVLTHNHLLMVRVDESLYFANALFLENDLMTRVQDHDGLTDVVLLASAVNKIDWSAMETLERINGDLKARGIRFHLAEVKGPVMDRIERSDLLAHLTGEIFLSASVAESTLGANGRGAKSQMVDGAGI